MLTSAPNRPRRWRWVSPGTVAATIAFLMTSMILREYVHYFGNYGKWYGSLAGVMLLSFWVGSTPWCYSRGGVDEQDH